MMTPSPAPESDHIRICLDLTAEMVSRRIRAWFDEREVWTREDLLLRSARDAISLDDWLSHERVKASGIRGVVWEPAPGEREVVYVLERETEGGR